MKVINLNKALIKQTNILNWSEQCQGYCGIGYMYIYTILNKYIRKQLVWSLVPRWVSLGSHTHPMETKKQKKKLFEVSSIFKHMKVK